jgi:sugar phosphate isomerase/epimerase
MKLSGIADEAGKPVEAQIEAHKKLGWDLIEPRTAGSANFTRIPEDEFNSACGKLEEAGIRVSCFASEIANWARKISGDFSMDVNDLKTSIPRMKKLNVKFIRVMSYPNDGWDDAAWEKEAVRRLRELTKMAEDGGIVLAHENCNGWGEEPDRCLALIEEINSPSFKMLFDTGNPVCHEQSSWDFYNTVKKHIVYVHIKDAKAAGDKRVFTYPGEGDGRVKEIIADLKASGYDGVLSIEPHLAAIIHEAKEADSPEKAMEVYIEYGRKLERIVWGEGCCSACG